MTDSVCDWPTPTGLLYLASPYSHPDPQVRWWRAHQASWAAIALLRRGYRVFSPIAHSAALMNPELPWDWPGWLELGLLVLRRSQIFAVLDLAGWDVSEGIAAETSEAAIQGMVAHHIAPWSVGVDFGMLPTEARNGET